jgi:hypothetical protein
MFRLTHQHWLEVAQQGHHRDPNAQNELDLAVDQVP